LPKDRIVRIAERQNCEDCRKTVEEAVDWLRKTNPDFDDIDDPTAEALARLASFPSDQVPRGKMNYVAESALEWLRNNDPKAKDVSDDELRDLCNLAGVSCPLRKLGPAEKKEILESTVSWLRNNKPRPSQLDNEATSTLANLAWIRNSAFSPAKRMVY